MREMLCTYLCPIRSNSVDIEKIEAFKYYWEFLGDQGCEVLVVDGSPPEVFDVHAREWNNCKHIGVHPTYTCLNGKVNGILTAVPLASHEKIILADDDVRYNAEDIRRMVENLDKFEVVRPQNYFDPLPVWAKLDAARILLNRAFIPEGDFPGTFGFRKNVFEAAGHFDGDVLFDNEELIKHFENHGANILYATDFFILRKPPTLKKWLEQRPRQAYEDFVMKEKTALFLSCIPLHLLIMLTGKRKSLGFLAFSIFAVSIFKAFKGLTKSAKPHFSTTIPFYAPLWILERSMSIYLALYWKAAKGGYPFGDKIIHKGTGNAWKVHRPAKVAENKVHKLGDTSKIEPLKHQLLQKY